MKNHLRDEISPYLLQHADNPVDWYPWCEEAFEKASAEQKPVFLSIGYSTCHWCHVMAHESFEDPKIAQILNTHFVSIKVDKEERPDIDAIYMKFCTAFTGNGGWPCSIFMTPEKKPFFAGTYFPKISQYGMPGFSDLLSSIAEEWEKNREKLLHSAHSVTEQIRKAQQTQKPSLPFPEHDAPSLLECAVRSYHRDFDAVHGGFGTAPKFPTPHNLLFLLHRYKTMQDETALKMAEKTLIQMYRGGIFDHIGFGFSRYSTDSYFLVPHFEKMLYDNALLILAYASAYDVTGKPFYRMIAEKTAAYIEREMTDKEGAFFSAQDADSQGVEGNYYLFGYDEVIGILGKEEGCAFVKQYCITPGGNFEGKNIPNLLSSKDFSRSDQDFSKLYEYRRRRMRLSLDDKILTSWNGLMIAALSFLSRVTGDAHYGVLASNAAHFLLDSLYDGGVLYVGCRHNVRSGRGFLDDYAFFCMGLIHLYESSGDSSFLDHACTLAQKAISQSFDQKEGGFFFYGHSNEQLILTLKETYDGAMPSGNSVMFYNLIKLSRLTDDPIFPQTMRRQMDFLCREADSYPSGYGFFLFSLSLFLQSPESITVVLAPGDSKSACISRLPVDAELCILEHPTREYPLYEGKTTYYVCRNHSCQPPVNVYEREYVPRSVLL